MSNEDLMTMVSHAADEIAIQSDLIKLFPGIAKLEFSKEGAKRDKPKQVLTRKQTLIEEELHKKDPKVVTPTKTAQWAENT